MYWFDAVWSEYRAKFESVEWRHPVCVSSSSFSCVQIHRKEMIIFLSWIASFRCVSYIFASITDFLLLPHWFLNHTVLMWKEPIFETSIWTETLLMREAMAQGGGLRFENEQIAPLKFQEVLNVCFFVLWKSFETTKLFRKCFFWVTAVGCSSREYKIYQSASIRTDVTLSSEKFVVVREESRILRGKKLNSW